MPKPNARKKTQGHSKMKGQGPGLLRTSDIFFLVFLALISVFPGFPGSIFFVFPGFPGYFLFCCIILDTKMETMTKF